MSQARPRREVIELWIRASLEEGGIDRYDDLHVNQIDPEWEVRATWLAGGLESFTTAREIRDQLKADVSIALAYSLESGEAPLGVDFYSPLEFQRRLDWSPPSLYLFRRGQEPWERSNSGVMEVDPEVLFGHSVQMKGCLLIEFRTPGSPEYSRTVFVWD